MSDLLSIYLMQTMHPWMRQDHTIIYVISASQIAISNLLYSNFGSGTLFIYAGVLTGQ